MNESFDLGSLIEEFRDEAREQVDRLDQGLLELEREGSLDGETRGDLLRSLHTLKGNAGMLGLAAIRDFVHVVETLLKPDEIAGGVVVDRLFDGATALRRAVEAAGGVHEPEAFPDLTAARRRLEAVVGGRTDDSPASEELGTHSALPSPDDERVRVPFAKLDVLLADVGELLGEAESLSARLTRASSGPARDLATAVVRRAERVRDEIMALRLVPLGRVLGRFHGLVRRLARDQGKEARLIVEGEATEVDKSTADSLAEPLLHLVRNAIDHGIEAPEVREAAGKRRHGTVRVTASQEGDRVRIQVEDDGAGLDLPAIRAQALGAGLVAGSDALSDQEVAELIFRSGFTTRSDVSTVSGRGVGLDVVHRRVRTLRGELRVTPTAQGGTRFVMILPLTVAIVPSLLFETGGEVMAVPASAVIRTLKLDRIERVGATEVVRDGESLMPLADPHRIFGWPSVDRGTFGVMLRHGRDGAVVTAGRLLDQRDLVIKAMPAYGARTPGVSGASVLPGGRVILLLDPADVIELTGGRIDEVEP